ncbi:MAG: hypothetical protein Q4D29_13610 [Lachnospiraceae bacterium]|nr:hypothetical protein [Lachnospiraceae bacterium]
MVVIKKVLLLALLALNLLTQPISADEVTYIVPLSSDIEKSTTNHPIKRMPPASFMYIVITGHSISWPAQLQIQEIEVKDINDESVFILPVSTNETSATLPSVLSGEYCIIFRNQENSYRANVFF